MATSVTQHGITINFDADYTVGQYVNGDYYVVAPSGLDIDSTSPAQSTGRNGIMVNPVTQSQGFDDRAAAYSSGLNVSLPYTASVGDSILVSTSDGEYVGTPDADYDGLDRSDIETIAILTVVSSAPASTAFRPPYAGTSKPTHLVSEVDLSILPGLSSASVTNIPALSSQIRRWERAQIDWLYDPNGQGIRPAQHQRAYGGNHVRELGEAFARLCLDDGTVALEDLAYGIIQYGIDLYYAQLNAGTRWPTNGGHNHGRKPAIVAAAILLDNASMKSQIKAWANTEVPANNDIFQDDWSFRYSTVAKLNIYGDDGDTDDYWTNQVNQTGNKAIKDPYGYIDGGETPGSSYSGIVDPPSIAWSLWAREVDGFAEVWNHSSLTRGDRTWNFGTWTLPDPYEHDGSGTLDGVGRYGSRHGVNHYNATYDSDFTESVFDTHVADTVFPPDISPHGTSQANSVTVTLSRFTRQDLAAYPSYWTQYPSEPADGTYPYLDGVTIRYTIDGTEPTASSTLYSAPFEISTSDTDSDGYVTVKAKAFKAGYDESASNVSFIKIRDYLRQAAKSNSGGSSVTTRTATFSETAEEGNIIVASASIRSRSTTISFDGGGWTYLIQRTSSPSASIAYKVVGSGGVDSVTASHTASSQRMAISIAEFTGVNAVQETAVDSSISTTASKTTGTAGSVTGNHLAVGVWAGDDNGTSVGSDYSYTNSHEEITDGTTSPDENFRARSIMSFKSITGTEAAETTVTVENASLRAVSAMLVMDASAEVEVNSGITLSSSPIGALL